MASEPGQQSDPVVRPAVWETYGPADLSAVPVFAGGFINFGYWKSVDLEGPLSQDDRVRSEQDLYRHVLDAAAPSGGRAVEVGCGLGLGCALALEEYVPAGITGVDIHPQQLQRARDTNARLLAARPDRLRFVLGAAEDLPFGDGEFDCLYSVEAAQHFPDLSAFARETARVLRPGGRVAVASFFTVDAAPAHADRLAGLLDSFASGLDIARPVSGLTDALADAGLVDVRADSIGPQVWPGWDRWLARLWEPGTWPRNFLAAWEARILDYYVVTATRP
ncbi:methyltransferase domain-containing protein [Streptomyces sp. NBC_00249]|uniref:class I SAM-dependent methyltransferase n=1 Tax=Streptomyces sp. NBC_00249 TaxID=2975690 RepID=UPI00224D1B56|nr:class I SAM-dependent methyltransferase [Streptomyces sp. NBC_00249]MCX5192504.1 methyltransferase domain-containing protein [Streptomyces sp. NBC_00249]